MGRPPQIPVEKKTRIVLSVIAGEMSIADAARREKVSEQSIGRWKAEFLEAGKTALAAGRNGPTSREEQLKAGDLEVIRHEAGVSTARWCRKFDIPERTWRRWQAKAGSNPPARGPWPRPARDAEHPFHISPTANQFDAIDAVELALTDYEQLFGHPLSDLCEVDVETGEIKPVVTIVTDNGGPFRSFRFEAFIAAHPELHHVRTRVRSPGQNGSRERGFGTLRYERLFIDEIDDSVMLAKHTEDYRTEYNTIRPHEAITWNRPEEVHLGLAAPTIPTFHTKEILPTT